ncbi:DMT family transporter [Desulfovibrio inopinatus]|uniref:DMT family transporter n=1 Tax=Desulfovibrio inopinatus TaxID=102109 RepID=UPI0003F692D4|nr:DMT family transporter [Desulfovibrio inopinatus]
MNTTKIPLLAILSLLTAMTLWGSSFIAMKIAMQELGPLSVVFGRMALATVCFALIAPKLVKTIRYQSGDWKPLLFMAFCEPCLYFVFESHALKYTQASEAGMVTALLPLMVTGVARVLFKENLSMTGFAGLLVSVLGVILMSAFSEVRENAPNPLLGNTLEFLAMICAAGYIISLKWLTSRYSPLFLTAVQSAVGAVFFLPALLIEPLPESVSFSSMAAVVYLGLVVSIVAYGCNNYGVSQIPASQASIFINLIPVVTLIIAAVVLGESLGPLQMLGGGMVFAGVFLSNIRRRARTPSTL